MHSDNFCPPKNLEWNFTFTYESGIVKDVYRVPSPRSVEAEVFCHQAVPPAANQLDIRGDLLGERIGPR